MCRKKHGKIEVEQWPDTEVKEGEEPKGPPVFRFFLIRGMVFNALSRDGVESSRSSLGKEYRGKMMNMTLELQYGWIMNGN